jgi:hypothetical protein
MADMKMLSSDPYTGKLTLGIPVPPEYIEGIDLLVQIVALLYMNNGGRSIANPGRAGGLREFIGMNYDPDDPAEVFTDIQLMTSRIEQMIKEEQVNTSRPPSERLQALRLIDIVPNEEQLELNIRVAVVNEEQNLAEMVVTT